MRYFVPQLMFLLLAVGCAGCSSPAGVADSPSPSAPSLKVSPALDHSIRRADFRNFTYEWLPAGHDAPAGVTAITLKDGEAEYGYLPGETPDFAAISFQDLSYGDVTGDGVEDAVVVLLIDGPGNPRPYGVFVYTEAAGSTRLLWAHTSGGGSHGGLRDAYAKGEHLIVEEYNPNIIDADGKKFYLGSAKTYTRVSRRWDGQTFQRVGSEELPHERDYPRYKPGPSHHEIGQQPNGPPG